MKEALGSLIRHALTAIGGAGLVVTDDLVTQVASALSVLAGLVLSVYKARKDK